MRTSNYPRLPGVIFATCLAVASAGFTHAETGGNTNLVTAPAAVTSAPPAATTAPAADPGPPMPPALPYKSAPGLGLLVILMVDGTSLFALMLISSRLKKTTWSLADALSEESSVQPDPAQVALAQAALNIAQPAPPNPANPPPPVAPTTIPPVMVASSSRLIALLGLVVILAFFLGCGDFLLWCMFTTGVMPDTHRLLYFIFGGASLFAPYVVNQARSAVESVFK